MMIDTTVAARDVLDGTKLVQPAISVKTSIGSFFFLTQVNNIVLVEPIVEK